MAERASEIFSWFRHELLQDVVVQDFDEFLKSLGGFKLTFAGRGDNGEVFRLQQKDMCKDVTVKVVRHSPAVLAQDFVELFEHSGYKVSLKRVENILSYECVKSSDKTSDLVLRQVAGHLIGNCFAPDLIDSPVVMWARLNGEGVYVPVAYSLPFIEGEDVFIKHDRELSKLANDIESGCPVYLGSRWSTPNAIRGDEVIKFIDVRVTDSQWKSLLQISYSNAL